MRYSVYIKLKEMLTTLSEAFQYIRSSSDQVMCIQLCLDSLEFIKVIKEKVVENNEKSISYRLIQQLELINGEINILLNEYQNGREASVVDNLLDDVRVVQHYFEQDIELVYHIVFFAELGQKWDSMKSVYEAFKKRNDCDVKVVLTPIFRAVKKEGGKIETEVIYEDYLTSMGIENIAYESYELSKELPDIAFVSNPYESVTLPQFWPENIAKYTRLVYLPYYTGMLVNDKSIQAHCGMPIAKHAWKIIAQSEKVKEMHEVYAPKRGQNVLVTGLPKWDNINDLDNLSLNFNELWHEKLNGKKVFLWNTHYDITSSESTIIKDGKKILDLFTSNKNIALIWRPHPMLGTIIKLYVPQYSSLLEELYNTIKDSDNIVVDTNTSCEMAFKYSDALISEYSSLIPQYLLTKKPVLLLKNADYDLEFTEELIQISKIEQADNIGEVEEFIFNIVNGKDISKASRMSVLNEDFIYVDGLIGNRVCNLLINELERLIE